jgi:hypothetical protein
MIPVVMPTRVGIHIIRCTHKDMDGGLSPAMTMGMEGS